MKSLREALRQGHPLLLDGATGTELNRRGLATPAPLWSAGPLQSHPDIVLQIHRDYVAAGADILTANTFRTHARNVGDASLAARLSAQAVALVQQAAAESPRRVWVAGSVAPLEDCYSPQLTPDVATCYREHQQHIAALAQAGVDFCLIETMNTLHEAQAAALACREMGLPFMLSFVTNAQQHLLSGEPLADVVAALQALEPLALLINCIPTPHLAGVLALLRGLSDLPLGAYGNMDTPPEVTGWAAAGALSPADYCGHAADWLALGLQIIGSCCGSSPAHTAALRRLIDQR